MKQSTTAPKFWTATSERPDVKTRLAEVDLLARAGGAPQLGA